MRIVHRWGIAMWAVLAITAPLHAQSALGTVHGTVTNTASGAPVASAQVYLASSRQGGQTRADGGYTILNVSPGRQIVRVRALGFAPIEKIVDIAAGQSVAVDFGVTPAALTLNEVVVTGTAGAARIREVGNSISSLKAADAPEVPSTVSELLTGRMAGVNVQASAGNSGAGSSIRLRGTTSVALTNQPLIYIDGVRMRSDEYPKNVPPSGSNLRSSNVNASPLNDINPDDIERVEIVKGAAASTLYGTDAAAGVIQVFTKRGATGAAQWNAQYTTGFSKLRPFGTAGADYLFMDPYLRSGVRQGTAVSVSGGTPQGLKYFTSFNYDNNNGVLPNDNETKYGVRGNFGFAPRSDLTVEWTSGYTNDDLRQTPAGNNAHGLTLNAFRRDRNYFASANPDTIRQVLAYDLRSKIDHLTLGGTATYTPLPWYSSKFTIGLDRAAVENRQVRPYGFLGTTGTISDQRWVNKTLSADWLNRVEHSLTSDLHGTVSLGTQYTSSDVSDASAYGEGLPVTPAPTVSSAAARLGFETSQRVVTAGVFGQGMLGYKDRYFLTVGMRVDGNSAFGQDFGLQEYPKVSVSWVVSDESFWRQTLGTLKLRAAYGEAGRAPGAFDAVTTYDAIGWGGQPAFRTLNVGNPVLGPERTKELELGFDATALDGRVSLDFTAFNAHTVDALLPVRLIPSQGFLGSQLRNVGKLSKHGIEAGLNATIIDQPTFGLTGGLTYSTLFSNVESLGGAPAFELNRYGWVYEGQPVGALRARKINNPDDIMGPGVIVDTVSNAFFGPSQPTRIISGNLSVRTWRGITISGRGEYQGGFYINEDASFQALSRSVLWPTCFDAYDKMAAGQPITVRETLTCIQKNVKSDMFIFPADFFKIRDVTLAIPLGQAIPRTRNAIVSFTATNFYRWQKMPLFDPEMSGNDGFNAPVKYISEHIPSPATFTMSLKLGL
jgi:outer membrane receptor protein involved in Fe transport